jgi:carboxylesterase type B
MIFLYGGGFTSGANGLLEYDGTDFVAEQGDIIIPSVKFVSLNLPPLFLFPRSPILPAHISRENSYRVNIFGFPNTPALATKNVGLLDQRLGVEWLRDNIASFGGDEKRMVLAGHSAGSQSIVYWSYAYAADPIVAGLIEFSGQPGLIATDDGTSWKSIANSTGCDGEGSSPGSEEELECMRSVPARGLKRAMSINNTPSFTDPVVNGGVPVVDNVTVFHLEEYTSRGIAGEFAKIVCYPRKRSEWRC